MNDTLPPGLYIVATPIGNLGDITIRAADVLRKAELIAAEDTRVTAKLLQHLGVRAPMTSYHDHNADRVRPDLLEQAKTKAVALVTDAGTPLISDPGYKLVRAAHEEGIAVTTLPGPCAAVAAMTVAGLPTDRFLFAGFLPPKTAGRTKVLEELKQVRATLVFYETGPRLADCLADIAAVLGDREVAIARELTKLHEEVRRGRAGDLARALVAEGPPRGEIVLVVGPPVEETFSQEAIEARLKAALATLSVKEAAKQVAAETGGNRQELYKLALGLTGRT
ncbi:16S rRNA (cytidine(1402)-2'-O)-methyltransferase [Pedomonas sp. V897]|uniref:16S rRNA (cytidine(1402)-2'-O)-methyltransferase n=1 Tax=Pedomonas sp. V897 TaxID=3446482 RepID=UPI003EE403E0